MKSLRAVTFDVGGTLIEPFPSVGHIYAEVAGAHGIQGLDPETLNRRFAAAWEKRRAFGYSMAAWSELVDLVFEGLVQEAPSKTFFSHLYDRFREASAWRVFEDVVPVLDKCRALGLKTAALSNWDERLKPLLKNLGVVDRFDLILPSSEFGAHKPDPVIFAVATDRLGIPSGQILHVGDSEREDFLGARNAGFQARWLIRGRPGDPKKGVVENLHEVLVQSGQD